MTSSASLAAPAPLAIPLFAVVVHHGAYEDAYQCTEFVTHDEAAATAYVEYQNALYASMRAKVAQSHKEGEAWAKANVQPQNPDTSKVERLPVPDWKGIKHITPEMRDERKRIKAENDARVALVMAPVNKWFSDRYAFVENWQNENLTPEEKAIHGSDDYTSYEVEALAWMPPLSTLVPAGVLAKEHTPAEDTPALA